MDIKRRLVVVFLTLLLATSGALFPTSAFADTPGQERREDRGDGRDVRQEGRQDAREGARDTRRGN